MLVMFQRFIVRNLKYILGSLALASVSLNLYLVYKTQEGVLQGAQTHTTAEAQVVYARNGWSISDGKTLSYETKKKESLSGVLSHAYIETKRLDALISATEAIKSLQTLNPGTQIFLEGSAQISSDKLIVPESASILLDNHKVEISYDPVSASYIAKTIEMPLQTQAKLVSGKVVGSLVGSMKQAGATAGIANQVINLFSYAVDFQRDIKAGDSFKIVYQYNTDYRGRSVKSPTVLYASLYVKGKERELYRYEHSGSKKVEYYDRKGNSIKRAFLKTPISGARVTSGYGVRTHPVLGFSRMHKGLDYGAPVGTPVFAAADGVVVTAKSLNRGYGRHIEIKHNKTYSTLYAHLSRFASNIRTGASVKQGQVIGYVGATGLASGPHLHYEVIESGRKVNPAKIRIAAINPLSGKELTKFQSTVKVADHMLATLDRKGVKRVAMSNARGF